VASRHEARRQAIDILYQADVTGADPGQVLAEWRAAGRKVSRFGRELVEGVAAHAAELDDLIGRHAEGWTVPRLAALDRTILRVACYELAHAPDTPIAVVIDEAVRAAKELSTEDSGRFVNGILGPVAEEVRAPTG
jgi:N utilization substance protein B